MQLLTFRSSRAAVIPSRMPPAPPSFTGTRFAPPPLRALAPSRLGPPRLSGASPYRTVAPPAAKPDQLPRDISSRFGRRLRELRQERGMTQLQLAVDFGIDRTFISDVERGRKAISLTTLEILALGFKLSLSDLLRDL